MPNNVSQREKWITVEGLAAVLAKELSERRNFPWNDEWFRVEILSIMLNHGIAGIVTLSTEDENT